MVFESIKAAVGGLGVGRLGQARIGKGVKSRKTLTADRDSLNCGLGSITCNANAWTTIGSYTVKPQTQMRWGYGQEGRPQSVVGVCYGTLQYDNAGVRTTLTTGEIRLSVKDSEGRVRGYTIVNGVALSAVNQSFTDSDSKHWLPETGPIAREDDQLIIEFNPLDNARNLNCDADTVRLLKIDSTLIS